MNLEQRSIDAFSKLEILEEKLKLQNDIALAGELFVARMDIHAYMCELKLRKEGVLK